MLLTHPAEPLMSGRNVGHLIVVDDLERSDRLQVARLPKLFDRDRVDVEPSCFMHHGDDGKSTPERVGRLDGRVPQTGMDGVVAVLDAALVEEGDEEGKVLGLVFGDFGPVSDEVVRKDCAVDLAPSETSDDVPSEVDSDKGEQQASIEQRQQSEAKRLC